MADEILFGRYRLLERAGTGGSAQVWRALDERTGDEVAVKRLHPLAVAEEASRVRLVREFRILRTLDDPAIVRVRDLEIGPREAALILDYVAGPSLDARLATGPPPSTAESLAIVGRVSRGLDAAHAAGIVHRDVKPGNVLLDPVLGARLTDFGIARGADQGTAVTAVGTIVGTFGYLSPERLRGDDATPASDVYALGALAWQLLAGRPAFRATTPLGLAEEIGAGPPTLEGFPPGVDAAIRRAMAADPSLRHASAGAFAAELRSAVAGTPVHATASDPTVEVPLVPVPASVSPRRPVDPAGTSGSGTGRNAAHDRRVRAAASLAALVAALAILAAAVPARSPGTGAPTAAAPTLGTTAVPSRIEQRATAAPANPAAEGGNGKGKGKGKGRH